jgi:hypothetical protein
LQIFLEPIGLVRNSLAPGYVEMEEGSTVGSLLNSLNLPLKLNVIAIVKGKRVSMDESVSNGSSIKIVSLTLGG